MNIESLQAFCHELPGVTEDIKWGNDLCFCIGEKMFCVTGLSGPFQLSFKVREDEFEELCSLDAFIPAPYLARYKWVLLQKPSQQSDESIRQFLKQSYELVRDSLPKKKRIELGLIG